MHLGSSGQGGPCSSQLGDLEHLGQGSGFLEGSRTRGHWASLKEKSWMSRKGAVTAGLEAGAGLRRHFTQVGTGRSITACGAGLWAFSAVVPLCLEKSPCR